jgi:hypothetical protein
MEKDKNGIMAIDNLTGKKFYFYTDSQNEVEHSMLMMGYGSRDYNLSFFDNKIAPYDIDIKEASLNINVKDLNNLSYDELKKQKNIWYLNAQKTGQILKIYMVAEYSGTYLSNMSYGPKYQYKDSLLEIYVDRYGGYATAKWNNQLVFSDHNEKLYIPGKWEEHLEQLYIISLDKKSQEEELFNESEKQKLLSTLIIQG